MDKENNNHHIFQEIKDNMTQPEAINMNGTIDNTDSENIDSVLINNNHIKPFFKVYEVVVALLIIIGFVLLLGMIIAVVFPEIHEGLLLIITSVAQTAAFISASYFIVKNYFKNPFKVLGFKTGPVDVLIFKGLGWGFLLYFLSVTLSYIVSLFYQPDESLQAVMQVMAEESNIYIKIGIVVTIIILAPIGEEIFFRGFFYAALRNRLGAWPGIIISGLVFAAMHLDLVSLLPLAGVGIGLAMIYQKYHNLWYNIITHAVFNLISLILFFIFIETL